MHDPYATDEPTYPTLPPPPPHGDIQHASVTCSSCGYDLTGSVIGGACPECGTHINPLYLANAKTNGLAVASMIMGILCFVITPFLFAPLGIIFGHIARKQIKTGHFAAGSAGYALTGLICSYIGLGITLVVILIFLGLALL